MAIIDPQSQLFLHLERRHQPMHVAGLQLFDRTAAPATPSTRLVDQALAENQANAPFNQRVTCRLGQLFWSTDQNFDIERHVRHHRLPPPGTDDSLHKLVATLHSKALDRSRPLWEFHIIEGLTGDRFALYGKFHHAMMDGVSAMQLTRRFLTPQADVTGPCFPWRLTSGTHTAGRGLPAALLKQTSALPSAARELIRTLRDSQGEPDFTGPLQAPPSLFNAPIDGSRSYAVTSVPLPRVRALAAAFKATLNDVVLALCATALRRYLIDRNALPEAPLIALLPLSLHGESDVTGNRLGMVLANLATNVADPVDRLATIKRSVDYWKQRYRRMTPEQIMAHVAVLSAPAGCNFITGLAPRRQSFNVVISNLCGSENTLYYGSARLLDMYPVSIVASGQALNISLVSYADKLEFGLTACRSVVPKIRDLLTPITDGIDELAARAGMP